MRGVWTLEAPRGVFNWAPFTAGGIQRVLKVMLSHSLRCCNGNTLCHAADGYSANNDYEDLGQLVPRLAHVHTLAMSGWEGSQEHVSDLDYMYTMPPAFLGIRVSSLEGFAARHPCVIHFWNC